jgi:dGTPase
MPKKNKGERYAAAWKRLTCPDRLRPSRVKGRSQLDARTEFENDFDRVVFSSSFRRLRNKAQVFSLEPHDFVRTRLTHSIEVATIGRSLGEGAAVGMISEYKELSILSPRDIGTIVATACLLHDIGNPPFGHSGEKAMGRWFSNNIEVRGKCAVLSHCDTTTMERAGLWNEPDGGYSFYTDQISLCLKRSAT